MPFFNVAEIHFASPGWILSGDVRETHAARVALSRDAISYLCTNNELSIIYLHLRSTSTSNRNRRFMRICDNHGLNRHSHLRFFGEDRNAAGDEMEMISRNRHFGRFQELAGNHEKASRQRNRFHNSLLRVKPLP